VPTARPSLPSSSATPSTIAGHSSHGRRSTSRRSRQRYGADLIRREAKALLDLAEKLDRDGEEEDEDEDEQHAEDAESDGDEADDDMRPEEAALANARHLARRAAASTVSSSDSTTTPRRRTLTTFTDALDALSTMSKFGKVVITGVGKSGLLARKAVATFNSLGASCLISPSRLIHAPC
jgi:hypothetical protein